MRGFDSVTFGETNPKVFTWIDILKKLFEKIFPIPKFGKDAQVPLFNVITTHINALLPIIASLKSINITIVSLIDAPFKNSSY